mmetsp:Transcript_75063/g.125103  ORF Transcript_75063/g.125103 Transcript_75063/m.125103 type:complete len:202 (-) Transcript_75063:269-874(-)
MIGLGSTLLSIMGVMKLMAQPSDMALGRHARRVVDLWCCAPPSLREQMKAYIDMVKSKGLELTAQQKAMIAEFEQDEDLLDQTGRVDFGVGHPKEMPEPVPIAMEPAPAHVVPQQASAVVPPHILAQPPVPTPGPTVAAPLAKPELSTAAQQMWLMQQRERDTAVQLLSQRLSNGSLSEPENLQLRTTIASLVLTLASATE